MRKAFSLVELIVVIGIIGILSGVLIAGFSGSTESARAAKCLSNMRSLAVAWNSGRAGSQEHISIKSTRTGAKSNYTEEKGWISSATKGLYPSASHQTFSPVGMYETDVERVDYAITNGWAAASLGNGRSALVCPSHAKKRGAGGRINWSYFMNAAFGWDASQGGHSYNSRINAGYIYKPEVKNADRLLIFAEIPFDKNGPGDWFPDGKAGTTDTDAILQYEGCDKCATAAGKSRFKGKENIGGNHKAGKRWYAHVAFADGHAEKLNVDGMSSAALRELTTLLCEGKAVGRQGNKYEEVK